MNYRELVLSDRPRAYWPMDEASGTVCRDISGHGYNGVYTNTAGYTYGVGSPKASGGRGITSATSAYMAPPSGAQQATQDYSRELWVKTTYAAGAVFLVGQYGAANGEDYWVLNANGRYYFFMYNGGYIMGPFTDNGDLTRIPQDGRVHHLAITRKNAGKARVFWDGYIVNEQDGGTSASGLLGTTAMSVGRAVPDNNQNFIGTMSDVAIYDYALSPSQVLQHFRVGAGIERSVGSRRARLR